MGTLSKKAVPRGTTKRRRNSPLALAVFALSCFAILVLIFAPKGTFVSQPTAAQAQR